jgi:hypothetical protein
MHKARRAKANLCIASLLRELCKMKQASCEARLAERSSGFPCILGSSQLGSEAVPVKAPARPGWMRLVMAAWEHPQFEADNKTPS